MMGKIYSQAAFVLLWLELKLSGGTLAWKNRLSSQGTNEYWERLSIVQEVILARELLIVSHPNWTVWDHSCHLPSNGKLVFRNGKYEITNRNMIKLLLEKDRWKTRRTNGHAYSLDYLIEELGNRKCKIGRAHV